MPREMTRLRFYRHKVNPYMPVKYSVVTSCFRHSQLHDGYGANNTFDDALFFSLGMESTCADFARCRRAGTSPVLASSGSPAVLGRSYVAGIDTAITEGCSDDSYLFG